MFQKIYEQFSFRFFFLNPSNPLAHLNLIDKLFRILYRSLVFFFCSFNRTRKIDIILFLHSIHLSNTLKQFSKKSYACYEGHYISWKNCTELSIAQFSIYQLQLRKLVSFSVYIREMSHTKLPKNCNFRGKPH